MNGARRMAEVILDTDVLVDVARGHQPSIEYLQAALGHLDIGISVITQLELLVGCRNKQEQRHIDRFLGQFRILALDTAISDLAVDLIRRHRLRNGLLLPDALIAATALAAGVSIVTRNTKHYRFIDGLALSTPADLGP